MDANNPISNTHEYVEQIKEKLSLNNARVISFGELYTEDYIEDRVNIFLNQDGTVEKVTFG